MEYLDFIKGDKPSNNTDLFDGINTTWSRVKGGEQIGRILGKTLQDFDYENPAKSVELLLKAYQEIQSIEDEYWKKIKSEEIKNIIAACMGLFVEAIADDYSATPGQEIELAIEAINRSAVDCPRRAIPAAPCRSSGSWMAAPT